MREYYVLNRAIHDTLSVLFPPEFFRVATLRRRRFARRFSANRASRSAFAFSLSLGLLMSVHILAARHKTSGIPTANAFGTVPDLPVY